MRRRREGEVRRVGRMAGYHAPRCGKFGHPIIKKREPRETKLNQSRDQDAWGLIKNKSAIQKIVIQYETS